MLNIKHRPVLDIAELEPLLSKRDGVTVKYVCSSAITESSALAGDIFYRETPHPEFGNRYFTLYHIDGQLRIASADNIEKLKFTMIEVDGQLHYSKHRHDYHSVGDVAIDGGRAYVRLVGNVKRKRQNLKVVNGEFVVVDLVADCRLAAKVLKDMNQFETGQSILLEAASEIEHLRAQVARLQDVNERLSWEANPDRSGGQFTKQELNDTGWL